jgi:hypothetical protein
MADGRLCGKKNKIKILKNIAYLMAALSACSHLAGPWTK